MAISPLEAARAAAAIDLPPRLSHTFVVLALFWPNVRPTQEHLAGLLHVSERTVNYRLAELERRGRIRRVAGKRGRATTYRLILRENAKSVSPSTATWIADQEQISEPSTEWELPF